MSGHAGSAVIDVFRYGYIRIIKVIHQPQTGHFAFDGCDAGSAADQLHDLVAVQLPAHEGFEGYDFAELIRPPRSAAYDTAQC